MLYSNMENEIKRVISSLHSFIFFISFVSNLNVCFVILWHENFLCLSTSLFIFPFFFIIMFYKIENKSHFMVEISKSQNHHNSPYNYKGTSDDSTNRGIASLVHNWKLHIYYSNTHSNWNLPRHLQKFCVLPSIYYLSYQIYRQMAIHIHNWVYKLSVNT